MSVPIFTHNQYKENISEIWRPNVDSLRLKLVHVNIYLMEKFSENPFPSHLEVSKLHELWQRKIHTDRPVIPGSWEGEGITGSRPSWTGSITRDHIGK